MYRTVMFESGPLYVNTDVVAINPSAGRYET
jgi:hypothetical protein